MSVDNKIVETLLHEALDEGVTLFLKGQNLGFKAKNGLKDPLKEKIKAMKPLIIAYLQSQQELIPDGRPQLPVLKPMLKRDGMPLSFSQRSLWLIDSLENGSGHYNLPATLDIKGVLNKQAFVRAVNRIVERHEVLRSRFWMDRQGELLQSPVEHLVPEVSDYDFSMLSDEERIKRWQLLVDENSTWEFALQNTQVWLRLVIVHFGAQNWRVLINMPHIVADGWSMPILLRELQHYYNAFNAEAEHKIQELPPLKLQYGDYAGWQYQWLNAEKDSAQETYWLNALQDIPQVHQLPLDNPRPASQVFNGTCVELALSNELCQTIKQTAKKEQVTPFIFLYCAFTLLLGRYSQERDIVVGSPIAGRNHSDTEELIGYFVNTLVLRTQLSSSTGSDNQFSALLQRVKQTVLEAYNHQHLPFEHLVERLKVHRSLSHHPVFQILFALQQESEGSLSFSGLELQLMSNPSPAVKFDLELNIKDAEGQFTCQWLFNTALFHTETVERMADNFAALLTSICASPDSNIYQLNMLSERESALQLQIFQNEIANHLIDLSDSHVVHRLFEEQVILNPDKVAAVDAQTALTYTELNEQANQLAHHLISLGLKSEERIAVYSERSHQLLVFILATLKAGGTYLPIDPAHPSERIAYILEDAKPTFFIFESEVMSDTSALKDNLPQGIHLLNIDDLQDSLAAQDKANPNRLVVGQQLAYMIYTSGSTGRPKGVLVEHRQWRNTLLSAQKALQFSREQQMPNVASQAFDISLFEQFLPLVSGGSCVVLSHNQVKNTSQFIALTQNCHFLHGVPSLLQHWLEHLTLHEQHQVYGNLKCLLVGGDAVPGELLQNLHSAFSCCDIVELYGPTEAAILSTFHRIDFSRPVQANCIGQALAQVRTRVMETPFHPAPVGVKGELWIGGAGVSRGYWQREELTSEKFIEISDAALDGGKTRERFYKSGDQVRRKPNGSLLFNGRVDDQVKINGYRIELGEIEHLLTSYPQVLEAVVMTGHGQRQDAVLSGFVVPKDSNLLNGPEESHEFCTELKRRLAEKLPDYMVPGYIIPLSALPLTDNGKVNRKQLRGILAQQTESISHYVAPKNDTERRVLNLFKQVFSDRSLTGSAVAKESNPGESIGVRHNFFELGGFSLLAMRLASLIQHEFNVDFTLREIFENPESESIAEVLAHKNSLNNQIELKAINWTSTQLRPASYAQQRLWFIDQLEGQSAHYNMPGAFRLHGNLDKSALFLALQKIVHRHEVLRSRFVRSEIQNLDTEQTLPETDALVEVLQEIHLPFEEFDLNGQEDPDTSALQILHKMADTAFDLSQGPLFKVALIALQPGHYIVSINLHHIVGDAWSVAVLVQEFAQHYREIVTTKDETEKGHSSSLNKALAVQYSDYAYWQKQWLSGENLERLQDYWCAQLSGLPQQHNIALDKPRPAKNLYRGGYHSQQLDFALTQKIKGFCKEHRFTDFMLLHSVFTLLLARIGGTEDAVIGTPTAGREHKDLAPVIGFFVNMLVLRSDLSGKPGFIEYARRNQQMVIDAFAHQQLPFELLVEKLQPQRDARINPLFQIVFRLDNSEDTIHSLPELEVLPANMEYASTKVDLEVSVVEKRGVFSLRWVYNTDLWYHETIQNFCDSFEQLAIQVMACPDLAIDQFVALSSTQMEKQIEMGQGPAMYGRASVPALVQFELIADSQPDLCAVIFEGTELTYGALNDKAERLAHYMADIGISAQEPVGIHLQPCLELHVALIAVMKIWAVYVPLEPDYPKARIQYIVEDSNIEFAITDSRLEKSLELPEVDVLMIDGAASDDNWLEEYSHSDPKLFRATEVDTHLNDTAYILYTSGSSGQPKGVVVSVGNLSNYLAHAQNHYVLRCDNTSTSLKPVVASVVSTPLCFDATITVLFTPLCLGAKVTLLAQGQTLLPELIQQLQSKEGPKLFKVTPSHLEALKNLCDFNSREILSEQTHRLVVGGEAFSAELQRHWQKLLPNSILINEYGPTESTVGCTVFQYEKSGSCSSPQKDVPIGMPIAGTQMYVVDNHKQLQTLGAAGELWIAGRSLASGYLNQSDKTAKSFLNNPFSQGASVTFPTVYRSGDLVRWTFNPDTLSYVLDYLGRIDEQVKLRGYRIELDEIRRQLLNIDSVNEAAVLVKSAPGGKAESLLAYVVSSTNNNKTHHETPRSGEFQQITKQQILSELSEHLPDYMLPGQIIFLSVMPLTTNGKIDHNALLAHQDANPEDSAQNNAPTTTLESQLLMFFCQVLGTKELGIDDNFFENGGHSLLATRLVSIIRRELKLTVDLRHLFDNPTVAALAKKLAGDTPQPLSNMAIKAVGSRDRLPLSHAQQRLWFIHQLENGSQQYHMPGVYRLKGDLNTDALKKAFSDIIQRHEVLRTQYFEEHGQPYQRATQQFTVPFQWVDLRDENSPAKEDMLQEILNKDIDRPFKFATELPIRVTLVKVCDSEHVLLINMHHIAADGVSRVIFFRELTESYSSYCQGHQTTPTPQLAIQYADYAVWQRDLLSGSTLETSMDYWQSRLEGIPVTHQLPLDKPRPPKQRFNGERHNQILSPEFTEGLKALCKKQQATLFMGLHSVFSVLISRYSGETDIVVGSPIAGRNHADIEPLIGFFVNTLVLRSDCAGEQSFTAILEANRKHILDAYEHQHIPLEFLVERLQPPRSLAHSPLFQILLTLQNVENPGDGPLHLNGLDCEPLTHQQNNSVKFDLELSVTEENRGLSLCWSFNSDLFLPDTIAQMSDNFVTLLISILETPQRPVKELSWVSAAQYAQLMEQSEQTPLAASTQLPANEPVAFHQCIEQWVMRNKDAQAISDEFDKVSYLQLNNCANQLAHYLLEHCLSGPNSSTSEALKEDPPIAIYMERGASAVLAMLAVLKAGAGYMPLEPGHPKERLEYLLTDSGTAVVICHTESEKTKITNLISNRVPEEHCQSITTLCLEELVSVLKNWPTDNPDLPVRAEQLAYLIYTSGSTGRPKGVMVEHGQAMSLINSTRQKFIFHPNDVWAGFHSFAFDFSVWEIWGALCNGAHLAIVSHECARDADRFYRFLVQQKITILSQTPTAFGNLAHIEKEQTDEALSLRYVVFGGEALNFAVLRVWLEKHRQHAHKLINMYGITETTVHTTFYEITEAQLDNIDSSVVGRPLPGWKVYLLNADRQVVAKGCHGEIYVGGAGVTRGYINKPEQNQERFVELEFAEQSPERLYRSGDMARYLPDGNLEYLGRCDRQVKIRGYRIELGEIENQILMFPEITASAVLIVDRKAGVDADTYTIKKIVAYIVLTEGYNKQITQDLLSRLKQVLPDYMLPANLIPVNSIPLTANGKVDSDALLMAASDERRPQKSAVTDTEITLYKIYSRVLKIDDFGMDSNYFELGGDSIISLQIVSEARKHGIYFQVRDIFEYQTIQALATALEARTKQKNTSGEGGDNNVTLMSEQGEVTGSSGLSPIQHWFVHQHFPEPHHWNQAILLNIDKLFDSEQLRQVFSQIVAQHDALRLRFDLNAKTQHYSTVGLDELFSVVDLAGDNYAGENASQAWRAKLGSVCNKVQASLNINLGPVVRFVLIKTPESHASNRLLVVAHHLVIDGVSWRILLDDFTLLLDESAIAAPGKLPPKTSSFKAFVEAIEKFTQDESFQCEAEYWRDIVGRPVQTMPKQLTLCEGSLADNAELVAQGACKVELNEQATEKLLRHVHGAYRTEINDLLITALGISLAQWFGSDGDFSIMLEGHGREYIAPEIDITRTVGWFTSLFPVVVAGVRHVANNSVAKSTSDIVQLIKTNKERLRQIPKKGVGYGVLRYLCSAKSEKDSLTLPSENHTIVFNYLGQTDNILGDDKRLSIATEPCGASTSVKNAACHALEINGILHTKKLGFTFNYAPDLFSGKTVQALADTFNDALERVIAHCFDETSGGITPSDIPLANLDQTSIDNAYSTPEQKNIEDIYPLSPLQEGMLFHHLHTPEQGAYVEQLSCEMHQVIDVEAMEKAWRTLVQQHSILRTAVIHDGLDKPLQVVQAKVDDFFSYRSLADLTEQAAESEFRNICKKEKQAGFNLGSAPLMRVCLLQLSIGRYGLIWTHHHLILDGWSLQLAFKSLLDFYHQFSKGELVNQVTLGKPDLYRDYISYLVHSQEQRDSASIGEKAFWQRFLKGCGEAATDLPLSRPAGKTGAVIDQQDSVYQEQEYALSKSDSELLQGFCQRNRLTLSTLLQAAWALVMQRYNRQQQVMFGLVVSGRPAEIEGIEAKLGLFINSQPVYVNVDESAVVTDWLNDFQQQQTLLRDYQHSSISDIQSWLPELNSKTLFETLVVFENYPVEEMNDSSSLKISDVNWDEHTHYPLTLIASSGDLFKMKLSYDSTRFEQPAMLRLLEHMQDLLKQLVEKSQGVLADIHFKLNKSAKQKSAQQKSEDPETKLPSVQSIQTPFEKQAVEFPHNIAVQCGTTQWSYRSLNSRANQLAHYLRAQGVGRESRVGVFLSRDVEMIAAVLGVLKAGAAYVPIDPMYPSARVEYILSDADVAVLITEENIWSNVHAELTCPVLFAGEFDTKLVCYPDQNPVNINQAHDLAYVIYTSGSTGKPKGVMIEHHNVLRLFSQTEKTFHFNQNDIWTCFHSLAFDFSVWEIFGALLYGGKTVVVPYELSRSPDEYYQLLVQEKITVLNQTPSAFTSLMAVDEQYENSDLALRKVIFGGEALQFSALKSWYLRHPELPTLVNMYGITELTVHVTACELSAEIINSESRSLIGEPIEDLSLAVVDHRLRPLPTGVPGELIIEGPGVARGYLNKQTLTQQKFVEAPESLAMEQIYRTGDLVCFHEDGGLEYLGRIDEQVKLRGFRIELGEIENALLTQPEIQGCKALVDKGGQLCGCLVWDKAQWHEQLNDATKVKMLPASQAGRLRQELIRHLPEYMIPGTFFVVQTLPLTANGKIDKVRLLDWCERATHLQPGTLENHIQPPTNLLEEQLLKIFNDVLFTDNPESTAPCQSIGIQHSFFDIGGHSILAVRLMAKIKQRLGVNLPLSVLFQAPTVSALASLLNNAKVMSTNGDALVPLSNHEAHQHKNDASHYKPMFMIAGAWGNVLCFYPLAQMLSGCAPLYGLQPPGLNGECAALASVEELADFYIQKIKATQPDGPYRLLGYSFGAQVVFEVTRRLESSGDSVELLSILDSAVQKPGPENNPFRISKPDSSTDNLSVLHQLTDTYGWQRYVDDSAVDDEAFKLLREKEQLEYIHHVMKSNGLSMSFQQLSAYLHVHHTQVRTLYEPSGVIKAPLTLYRAKQAHTSFSKYVDDQSLGWEKYCEQCNVFVVDGDHDTMLHAENITDLGNELRSSFRKLQEQDPTYNREETEL